MSEATIVSIFPLPLAEVKPGLYPGRFEIPAAADVNKPVLFVIEDCVTYTYIPLSNNKHATTVIPALEVARSICMDFRIACLGYREDAYPGLAWLPGKVSKPPEDMLRNLREAQNNWFLSLVKLADDDWAKNKQQRTISDTQRFAAKTLNLRREWVDNLVINQSCPACGSHIRPEAFVCPHCKVVIDAEKAKAFNFIKA